MLIEYKTLSVTEVKLKVADNDSVISGYASVFNGIDAYGDTINRGAFAETLANSTTLPAMFFNHIGSAYPANQIYPARIGRWIKMVEDENGLYVEGVVTKGHPVGDAVVASMRNGTIDGLSIGFTLNKNGYKKREGAKGRIISKIDKLIEVSIVEEPADRNARIESVKCHNGFSAEDIEALQYAIKELR